MGPSGGPAPLDGKGPIMVPTPATTPVNPDPAPRKGGDSSANLRNGKNRQVVKGPELGNSISKPDTVPQQTPAATPTPVPTPPVKDAIVEAPTPAADLSSLSAQASIQPQEGSIHVTVTFKNAGSQKLSVILDNDQSILMDEQGRRYSSTDFSLPASGANPRLDLAANNSTSGTFDFPAPQLGSKKFRLSLTTVDGHRIKVSNP
jgi:hypothetical protein